MKIFLLATGLLALCACNAFDEDRLLSRRSNASRTEDAGSPSNNDQHVIDASAPDDDDHELGHDDPQLVLDSGVLEHDTQKPDEEEPTVVCDDEDGGAPSDSDSDDDGVLDCMDACPFDPAKTHPGACGCSHPEDNGNGIVSCMSLRSALAHRWTFDGAGNVMLDAWGNGDAFIKQTELTQDGALALEGGTSGQYVDLPNDALDGLTNVTIEAWITWTGSGSWQRIFDFGNSDSGMEDVPQLGTTYLMMSPRVYDRGFGASFSDNGPEAAMFVEASEPLPMGGVQHVALVFDDSNDQLRLYLNGRLVGSGLVTGSLSSLVGVNNWLGRSQFSNDPAFSGSFHELRIYRSALTDAQMALSFEYGTDPLFLAD